MIIKESSLKIIILFFLSSIISAQIKLIHLPPRGIPAKYLLNNLLLSKRTVISLNDGWQLFNSDDPERKLEVKMPLVFSNPGKLVFEKSFEISSDYRNKQFKLIIYGLNYSADIILNDITVGRNVGMGLPVEIKISPTLLNFKNPNIIKILLQNNLDSKNTLPVNQRFIMPAFYGGINGNILLEIIPSVAIGNVKIKTLPNFTKKTFELKLAIPVKYESANDEKSFDLSNFKLKLNLIEPNRRQVVIRKEIKELKGKNEINFKVKNAIFWTPENPSVYVVQLQLFDGDKIVDEKGFTLPVLKFSPSAKGILLNGQKFVIKGVTYSPPDAEIVEKQFANQAEADIKLIKNAGFNFIKFKGFFPHPFLLKLCETMGIVPAVELPIQTPPVSFIEDNNYIRRVKLIADKAAAYYSRFPVLKFFGIGLFNGVSGEEKTFVSEVAQEPANYGFSTFASFLHLPEERIENLDFTGIEVYAAPVKEILETLKESRAASYGFVGEISYPNNYGKTSGYLNRFSQEAQAKYFSDLITLTGRMGTNGFVINSFFNYRGNFCSLYAKFNKHNVYHLGLTGENRKANSFALNIIRRLLRKGKITPIPIGSNKNASPMFFIIVSLILGVLMGLLFNSKRKFREDAGRALSRPYNFFADVRDRRILISFQTVVLTFLLAAIHGLLLSVILFYLRTNVLFEKILLAFNSPTLIKYVSYLSWNPVESFLILTVLTLLLFFVLIVIIKTASGFVKQLVLVSNIFNVVIWSFLPLTILLPLELILHKLLLLGFLNIYIYAVLVLFFIWVIRRILRGIYVIFDVNPFKVYLGGLAFLVIILGLVLIYYQTKFYTYNYIISAFRQFPII